MAVAEEDSAKGYEGLDVAAGTDDMNDDVKLCGEGVGRVRR